jgi:hypothetical protein
VLAVQWTLFNDGRLDLLAEGMAALAAHGRKGPRCAGLLSTLALTGGR